ncbi:MAG: RES family NAD+ phosphorylase [Rhodospirillales bacterium]|nr:RES family NAD+ phosphorylase [Rhodospirillales bacterium]
MDEIARPHLPGTEHLEYVPTQAVAEYLVYRHKFNHKGETDKTIDAVVYRSAQRPNGKNIAIFGDAAVVQRVDASGNHIDERAGFRMVHPGIRAVAGSVEECQIRTVTHRPRSISNPLYDVGF